MADAAYIAYQNNVQSLIDLANTLRGKISALQTDAGYLKNQTDYTNGNYTIATLPIILTNIQKVSGQITTLQNQLDDIERADTGTLAMARKAVTDYQATSPTLKAQMNTDAQNAATASITASANALIAKAQANKTTIITVAIFVIVIVGLAIGIAYYKRKQKQKA